MSNIKAVIIGVSEYKEQRDLPCGINDIEIMKNVFIDRFKLDRDDIKIIGKFGTVNKNDLLDIISDSKNWISPEDTFILYFSGHGGNNANMSKHSLYLSDSYIPTQYIFDFIDIINCKNKVVFLDCCFSGNFSLDEIGPIEKNEFSNGVAVVASSSKVQVSRFSKDSKISIFTELLCKAIEDESIVKESKISLDDIVSLVKHNMELRNLEIERLHNKNQKQNIEYKSTIKDAVFFEVYNK